MKLLGLLLILNSLVLTGYWVIGDHTHKGWAITICVVTIIVGIAFTFHERALEITFSGIGTIKAAAKQAAIDANAVSDLKDRVESQSATVDLVAQSAAEARKIVDKLTEKSQATDEKLDMIDETIVKAQEALKEIKRITEFATDLLAAQNDNWKSFEQLRQWGDDTSFPLNEVAVNAYVKIRTSYGGPIKYGYLNIKWPKEDDPAKLSMQDFLKTYRSLNPIFHTDLVNTVWEREDIPKKKRMAFLHEVIRTSNSLTARDYAADFFVREAGDDDLKWQPFNIKPILNWWEEHGESVQ